MADDERPASEAKEQTEAPDEVDQGAAPTRRRSLWRELPMLVLIAMVVALLVRAFAFQSFWIPSGSMEDTLQVGDRVLVNKLSYLFDEPGRGEVVVFESPMEWRSDPADVDFIKRIIGVGGDTVSYRAEEGMLSINGVLVDGSSYLYVDPETGEPQSPSKDDYEFEVTIPQGRLWVMGDHRWASGDSREHYLRTHDIERATIPVDAVVGRAFIRMWPPSRWHWLDVPESFEDVPNATSSDALEPG